MKYYYFLNTQSKNVVFREKSFWIKSRFLVESGKGGKFDVEWVQTVPFP